MKVRAVTLDFGGTLDGAEHWRERYWRLYRSIGVADRPAFDQAFDAATRASYAEEALRMANLEELVRYQVGQQCRHLQLPIGEVGERIVRRFVAESRGALQRHALLLQRWRQRVRLGVISNFYGNLPRVLAAEGMAPLFDALIDSTLVGARKPDRAIFQIALQQLGCQPREVLHVGDSLEHDVYGARSAGLGAAWLRSAAAESLGLSAPGDVIQIDTLAALEDYFPWKLH